jgi:hypothetical protein
VGVSDALTPDITGANVVLHVREGDRHLSELVKAFDDGLIIGIQDEDGDVVLALKVPAGSWEAAVSQVELRLDRLSFDWRAHIACRRP